MTAGSPILNPAPTPNTAQFQEERVKTHKQFTVTGSKLPMEVTETHRIPSGPTPHFSEEETKARNRSDLPKATASGSPGWEALRLKRLPHLLHQHIRPSAHCPSLPCSLPGSPLPTLLVMVWLCSRVTALFTAKDSSSWHHDLSRAHSGFSRRRVTWLTKVPVSKRRNPKRMTNTETWDLPQAQTRGPRQRCLMLLLKSIQSCYAKMSSI